MKQQNNVTKFPLLLTLLIVSTLLLASCQTSPAVPEPKPASVDLTWPAFPDPIGLVLYDKATGLVSMPLDYWESLTRYVIDIEKNRKIIEGNPNVFFE